MHVFDKQNGKTFSTNPRNVMSERDFNVVPLRDGTEIDFEDRFTYIENIAKPAIQGVVENRSLSAVTEEQYAAICTFFVVQMLRSKMFRESMLEMPRELKRRFPTLQMNDNPEYFEDSAFEKLTTLRFATEAIEELALNLTKKRIVLFEKACSGSLYISDNPFVMHNDREFGPYGNIGLGVAGIQIYHPISKDLLVGFLCPSILVEIEGQAEEALRTINLTRTSIFRTGSPTFGEDLEHLRDLQDKVKYSANRMQVMFDTQHSLIDSENLLFFNSLQMQASYRFVASDSSDFSFAKQAMRERPGWRRQLLFRMN